MRQSNPPLAPPSQPDSYQSCLLSATLHTLAPQKLLSHLWESQSGMRPRGDQEKINGCVAMVIAVDSRASSPAVLKQNKSKEPPQCSCCVNNWTMDTRDFEESRGEVGQVQACIQCHHCPELLATISILPAQVPAPVLSRQLLQLKIFKYPS